MSKYYFEREHLDMELYCYSIHPDIAARLLDWCVKKIKGFEFVKFYDEFEEMNKRGYSRDMLMDILNEWGVFKDKRGKYKMKEMYRFLSYNRELYEHVQRNYRFEMEHLSIRGLVNVYDLQNVLLLRFDDYDYYAPYVMFEMCMAVMWYGMKQLQLSYQKVKDGNVLGR